MIVQRLSLMSAAVVVMAGCSDTSEAFGPVSANASVVSRSLVVGSGHVQTAAGLREFTFHAIEHPQSGVSGSYKVVLPNGLFFEADVTCMAVVGNTGWVAGTIRATNAAVVVVGSRTMFYAIDNGEGEGSPDIVSTAAFNAADGTDLAFCADRPLVLPPQTVTDGNVQVR